jgi:ferredoxin-type protein NapH
MRNGRSVRYRLAVMLLLLTVAAVGYFTVGGVGNVCAAGFDSITLLCPLGALLAMVAERTAIPLALVSVAVALVVCVLLGKVFCSWACPVPFLSRLGRPRHKKGPSEARQRPAKALDSRHGILLGAIATTLVFGFPVFCLVCPVGLVFATVLLVMRLFVFGETTWTLVVFPLIIAAELFLLPRWCNNFCPLGALLSLFSSLNRTFRPQIDRKACLRASQDSSCRICEQVCPQRVRLHDGQAGARGSGDCSKCRTCADACPGHAISFPLLRRRSTEDAAKETRETTRETKETRDL